jgi:uncharacterized membrane protein
MDIGMKVIIAFGIWKVARVIEELVPYLKQIAENGK